MDILRALIELYTIDSTKLMNTSPLLCHREIVENTQRLSYSVYVLCSTTCTVLFYS